MFAKMVLSTDLTRAWDEIVACAQEFRALGCSQVILTHVITVKFRGGALSGRFSWAAWPTISPARRLVRSYWSRQNVAERGFA